MKLGATAIVVRSRDKKPSIDPIDSTINDGPLHLEASIRARGESGPLAIVLGKGSTLKNARVNDEVSRRVLSFVAPVLDNATRVRGRVSATIDRAVFPLEDDPASRGPTVEGAIVFQDVAFVPGPLLDDLFALVGRADRPSLKLNEPVSLTIADRRVYQRGLTVPIGNLSKIELDGWVGFNRDLNLTASIPILPTMLADRPILGAVAGDARVRIPIRGTLQKPEVDAEAFKLGMKDMGRSLLERGAVQGAAGLIERMLRPRDPNAPPPLTPGNAARRRSNVRSDRKTRTVARLESAPYFLMALPFPASLRSRPSTPDLIPPRRSPTFWPGNGPGHHRGSDERYQCGFTTVDDDGPDLRGSGCVLAAAGGAPERPG